MGWMRVTMVSGTLLVSTTAAPVGIAYPAPDPLPPAGLTTLVDRYQANRTAMREALLVARARNDTSRMVILDSLAERNLSEFDARGSGRVVEVIGDLVAADRIVVLVPGSHITLDNYDGSRSPGGGGRALAEEIAATGTGDRVAVVAWLGYDTPQGLSPQVATDALAQAGASTLLTTVDDLRAANPDAPIGLFCHSYGSVVCAYAAPQAPVADLVFYGSPGVGRPLPRTSGPLPGCGPGGRAVTGSGSCPRCGWPGSASAPIRPRPSSGRCRSRLVTAGTATTTCAGAGPAQPGPDRARTDGDG